MEEYFKEYPDDTTKRLRVGVLLTYTDEGDYVGMVNTFNGIRLFGEGYQDNPHDWTVAFPHSNEVVACPPQEKGYIGNAIGCKIVLGTEIPEGWSDAAVADAFCCQHPDGSGGWYVYERPFEVEAWKFIAAATVAGIYDKLLTKANADALAGRPALKIKFERAATLSSTDADIATAAAVYNISKEQLADVFEAAKAMK